MKNHINRAYVLLLTLGILLTTATQQNANAQNVTVSYQTFYDNLSPYGQWVYDPDYGNVWIPNEDGNFRPYGSRGQWVMTEYGNTWISDDPWGWAVYHYGRWTFNPYYGWIWVPGYEWAPAWVSWRYGGGYAGWAPLGPGINVGMSYYAPDSWWIFVGPQYIYQPNCIRYWSGPSYNTTYIRHTTIINNYYVDNSTSVRYNYGPRAEVIQQSTRRPVQVYRVSQLNRPGAPGVGRNTVSIYRPSVNRSTVDQARPNNVMRAPQRIGRAQPATRNEPGRQPAFRQEVQRQNASQNGDRGRTNVINNDTRGSRTQPSQPNRYDSRMDSRVPSNNGTQRNTPDNARVPSNNGTQRTTPDNTRTPSNNGTQRSNFNNTRTPSNNGTQRSNFNTRTPSNNGNQTNQTNNSRMQTRSNSAAQTSQPATQRSQPANTRTPSNNTPQSNQPQQGNNGGIRGRR